MKGGAFGALSLIAVLTAVPALATDPAPAAFKTVASQAYVDLTRQSTISATSDGTNNTPNYVYNQSTNPNAAGSVVTTTTTAGTVGERGIATAPVSDGNGGYSNGDWLPTVNAMMGAINTATNALTWTSTETTAVGNYSTTFDGQTGNWPTADADKLIDGTGLATALSSKQNKIVAGTAGNVVTYSGTAGTVGSATVSSAATYTNDTLQNGDDIANITAVETKQDKIVASDILLLEEDGKEIQNDIYTPSIVTHDSNHETLVGTQFGILSNSVIDDADIGWEPPYLYNYNFADRDDLVPTVAALMPMFDELWNNFDNYGDYWNTLAWTGSTGTNSQIYFINNYTSRFEVTGGPRPITGWPAASSANNYLVNHKFLVNALALKQNKIASSGYYYNASTGTVTSYNTNASTYTGSWLNAAVKGTGLVTKTSTAGVVGERKIFEESDVANYHADGLSQNQMDIQDISIPTVGAVKSMLGSSGSSSDPLTWDTAETAAANAYSTTFSDSGTNTWPESDEDMVVNGGALANALSLKQNKITTGLVELENIMSDSNVNVPALVATNAAGTELSGNTIGIARRTDIPVGDIFYYIFYGHDNFVPSLRLMATELNYYTRRIYDSTAGDTVVTLTKILRAVSAYSATFSDSGTNTWPSVTQNRLVNGETLAWTLGTKQNKINSTSNGVNNTPNYVYDATTNPTADGSVVTTTTTQGVVSERGIATAPVSDGNGGYSNGDWLPTVDAMMNAIDSHTPTGTQNTIANYGANGALGSGIATYDGSGTYAPATDAGKIATAAAVETKQDKIIAGNALFFDDKGTEADLYLPGLVAYDSTTQSLKGDQIGILSYGNMQDWQLDNILTLLDYPLIADKAVPTVGSVAASLADLANSIENAFVQKQNVLSPQFTATTGKTDLVPAGGETIAFDPESDELSPRYITGTGTEGLTTKTGANSVIDYVNGTVTLDGMQISNFGALFPGDGFQFQKNNNYIKNALVSLETLKDVYSDLNTKITAISRPTGTTGTVATYNGVTNGVQQFTETAIYNTANAYNASTDANKLATAGFVATKQNQIGATTSTYVYDSTNNTTADGSVVTTNTLGVTGERGIATAPVYTTNNNVTTLTNSSWLPTMGAMMNQINTATATLTWTSTETTAVGNYSTTFDGQTGNWPAADADKKVDGTALAAALATKQNKMVCTGWSSDTHTDANCWIWSIE